MKLSLEQQCILSVLQSQYHACWCSDDFRSQGISRHGIDPLKVEYSVSCIRRVKPFTYWAVLGNIKMAQIVEIVPHGRQRPVYLTYSKTFNISRTLVGNKIVDSSDVVGASPVGAAPTTSSFSTKHLASMDWAKTTARGYKQHLSFGIWCDLY